MNSWKGMYTNVFELDEKKGYDFFTIGELIWSIAKVCFGVFVALKVTSLRKSKMG
jgi:hypothetical protein